MSDRSTKDAAGAPARHDRSAAAPQPAAPSTPRERHPRPSAEPRAASMRDLLAACAAANAVSTPPSAPEGDTPHRRDAA